MGMEVGASLLWGVSRGCSSHVAQATLGHALDLLLRSQMAPLDPVP